MAIATPDSYTAVSGATVRAGIGTAITNSIYTPAKDSNGIWTSASRQAVPVFQWLKVAGSSAIMDSVIQYPRYTTSTGMAASDASGNIVRAWSSMAHDRLLRNFYVQGGGHSDTSKLENGVYKFSCDRLEFSRFKDHAPISAWQIYDANGAFTTINHHPYAANGAGGGEGAAAPLADNSPGSVHNYGQLVHIPASYAGNTNGWLYQGGWTRSVLDLDTGVYKVCHYWGTDIPPMGGIDWGGGVMAWVDGDSVYHHRGGVNHHRFVLAGSEATTWSYNSTDSFGVLLGAGSHYAAFMGSQYDSCWVEMPERRETAFFFHDGVGLAAVRIQAGAAIDTNNPNLNWSPYTHAITLTSSDNSLADFTQSTFHDGTVFALNGTPNEGNFASCGVQYYHADNCIYLQGNLQGSKLYKITGINTSQWDVSTVAGVTALSLATQFTFGRFRIQEFDDGTAFAFRLTSTTQPIEILRLV